MRSGDPTDRPDETALILQKVHHESQQARFAAISAQRSAAQISENIADLTPYASKLNDRVASVGSFFYFQFVLSTILLVATTMLGLYFYWLVKDFERFRGEIARKVGDHVFARTSEIQKDFRRELARLTKQIVQIDLSSRALPDSASADAQPRELMRDVVGMDAITDEASSRQVGLKELVQRYNENLGGEEFQLLARNVGAKWASVINLSDYPRRLRIVDEPPASNLLDGFLFVPRGNEEGHLFPGPNFYAHRSSISGGQGMIGGFHGIFDTKSGSGYALRKLAVVARRGSELELIEPGVMEV
jgi:hypothetical protein